MIKTFNKKSQMIFIELALGVLLFVIGISLYFRYSSENTNENNLQEILENAKDVSSSLISPGYPVDWNSSTVLRIGLTNGDNRINETKLLYFYNMSYDQSLLLLSTSFDYYVYFKNRDGEVISLFNSTIQGIGKLGKNSTNLRDDAESIAVIERIVVLDSDLVKMIVVLWSI